MRSRSGHVVKGTALTAGLFASLLAPWISFGVQWVQLKTGVIFDAGYDEQVLVLCATCCAWLASEIRMRLLQHAEAREAATAGGAPPPA